ncbi:MAG: glycosyltransferase family 4 protein [Alistipes sp.]
MSRFHKIFITNLPSFYKVNLYNRINREKPIFVIFTGDTANVRNMNFFDETIEFKYADLKDCSKLRRIFKSIHILRKNQYDELVISGVSELIYWICAFMFPYRKNASVCESSYLESPVTGLKGFLKRLYIKRISRIYASGAAQEKLVRLLEFKGEVVITKGVGVFNYIKQPPYVERKSVQNFLYVGRLSPEKNLEFLIKVFNGLPNYTLNIIGFGPLEQELKAIAGSNIVFHGAVDNKDLYKHYQANDVFTLPSISEPWGLVVEEALNNGLPVIVSDRVGCGEEIIDASNGLVFVYNDAHSLQRVIGKMSNVEYYNRLRFNISKSDFAQVEQEQINCYL